MCRHPIQSHISSHEWELGLPNQNLAVLPCTAERPGILTTRHSKQSPSIGSGHDCQKQGGVHPTGIRSEKGRAMRKGGFHLSDQPNPKSFLLGKYFNPPQLGMKCLCVSSIFFTTSSTSEVRGFDPRGYPLGVARTSQSAVQLLGPREIPDTALSKATS